MILIYLWRYFKYLLYSWEKKKVLIGLKDHAFTFLLCQSYYEKERAFYVLFVSNSDSFVSSSV